MVVVFMCLKCPICFRFRNCIWFYFVFVCVIYFQSKWTMVHFFQIKWTVIHLLKCFPYLSLNHLFPDFAETLVLLVSHSFEGFRETVNHSWKPSTVEIGASAGMASAMWYPSFLRCVNIFVWDHLSYRQGIACSAFKWLFHGLAETLVLLVFPKF